MQVPANTHASEDALWQGIPSFRRIDSQLRQVRQYIREYLLTTTATPELAPLYEYLSARNGKMVRPGLVVLVGACLGRVTDAHLRVSAMVQMIHDATLLHDDVIDDGERRRGAPTVNSLWGNESAVLLGDFVLSRVFRMAADLDPSVAGILAQTAVRVCEGELRQVMRRRNWELTESEYIDIISDKSAAFFSGCCRLGAVLAGAGKDQVEAASSYGLHAGIAFQITDDILDIAGNEGEMGKTALSDFDNSKLTLPVIHLLGTLDAADRKRVYDMLAAPADCRGELVDMLVRGGSLLYARQQARRYVAKAIEALETGLPAGDARDALAETARFMADRAT